MQNDYASAETEFNHTSSSKDLILRNFRVERGETEKNVNYKILEYIINNFNTDSRIRVIDLPCGNMQFLGYLQTFFPKAMLYGADIKMPVLQNGLQFIQMDLTKDFPLAPEEKFDLVTSISGVMMFSNTLSFISNCASRLNKDATFIITNDNFATIRDKLLFFFFGRNRLFKPINEDTQELTQNISIQELCRLLRTNGLAVEEIKFTALYIKDLIFLPIAILIYPLQWLYIRFYKTKLPAWLKWQMFPFKHYFCKHYIIIARKSCSISSPALWFYTGWLNN